MSRFAIVAPINIIQDLWRARVLGRTHLLLAHDVVEYPDEYRKYFHPDNMSDPRRLVILDNSVVELGTSVDNHTMVEAAGIVIPDVIVLPDVPLNMRHTIDAAKSDLNEWTKTLTRNWQPSFMLCLQGSNLDEYVECAEAFSEYPQITWLGVPRDALKVMSSRKQLIEALPQDKQIHLLGFSDDIEDDIDCACMSKVSSIDSAVPLRFRFPLTPFSKIPRRGDWWDTAEFTSQTISNLRRVREWIGDDT